MTDLDATFLRAASNLVTIQGEVLAEFELAASMSAYDYWIRRRTGRMSAARQSPRHAPWRYHFHGLEVDVVHDDGRQIRIDLGPRGMTNVFTGWGVAVHVIGSKPPWPTYDHLREFIVDRNDLPNVARTMDLAESLFNQGMFAYADPELTALRDSHTRKTPGGSIVEIPPHRDPEAAADVFLCDRYVLTEMGRCQVGAV